MKKVNILPFLIVLILYCCVTITAYAAGNPYISSHGINFAIGNKYHQETDITIEGPVSPLSFTRHYNSLSTVDDDIGYGWSHSFADKIDVSASVIRYTRPDGRAVDYIFDSGSSSWIKEAGKVEKITQEADGYYLKKADNSSKKFDLSTGQLLAVTDRHGNTTTLTYSTGQTAISDNFGRQLTLLYNGEGKLETLVTPVGSFTYSYDSGNLIRVYRPDSTTIYREYSYSGTFLTGLVNEIGNTLFSVSYTDGKVSVSSLQSGMHPLSIDYQAEDLVVITDGTTLETTTYNLTFEHGIAQVASFTGPGCSFCSSDSGSHTYNDRFQVESTTDADNVVTSYLYDANGNRETVTEDDGGTLERTTTTLHDPITNQVTSITRESVGSCGQQAVTTWAYDANNNPDYKTETGCSGTNSISRTTDFAFDAFGRITYYNGPRPDASITVGQDDITYTYYPDENSQGNKQGMLHTVTNGLGHVTEFIEYNGLRKPTLIEDVNGIQTNLSYNDFGQLTIRTIGTRTITYEYDDAGVLQTVYLPQSRTLHYDYQYSATGKDTKITDNAGNYLTLHYDSLGHLSGRDINSSDETLEATISYVHDIKGRLIKIYDTIGSDLSKPAEELLYDDVGNLQERKVLKDYDSDTFLSTVYSYDNLKRLTGVQHPGSVVDNIVYGYDSHDNQTSVTDDNGVVTSFLFDDFGRRTRESITENGVENLIATYEYDLSNNLIQKTDGNGKTINYQHDALNRLLDVSFSEATQDVAYIYDQDVETVPNKGRLTTMTDGSGSSSYGYNEYGELTKETRITEGHTFITEYGYNDNGELEFIVYPSGRKITYNRTAIGQLRSVDSLYQGESGSMASSITSKPFGPITSMTLGNGQQLIKNYDTLYRLSSSVVDSLYNRGYTYWSNGQIHTITDGVNSADSQLFTYDNLDHLNTANGSYGSLDFDHDGVGNRTNLFDSVATTTYDYFTGSNRISQVSNGATSGYGYDNIGNITTVSQDNTVFNWTDDIRLQSVTKNSVPVGTYKYDGRGLRTVKTAGGETGIFVYGQDGNLLAEADEQGNVLKEYVYVEGQVFVHFQYDPAAQSAATEEIPPEIDLPAEEEEIIVPLDDPLEAAPPEVTATLISVYLLLLFQDDQPAEGAYYYINDHLGTPQIITNDRGTTVWMASYSPFGTVTVDPSSTIVNHLRFAGQYYDAETGLHYNYHRYYDPATGRYISADPIGLQGGINLYAYTGNNPINYTDPLGLYSWSDLNDAWSHYCDGSKTPWHTTINSIDLGDYRSRLKTKISKSIGGGSCCTPSNSQKSFIIKAQTQGADAFIIGRHNLKAEGRLIVNADCSWSFSGTISSATGVDPYNFNPSNRGVVGETTTWIGRNRCPNSGRTFDINIVGTLYVNVSSN